MNKSCSICVVIPIHKEVPTYEEAISLAQCGKTLKKYDLYLIYPTELDIEKYLSICPEIITCPVPEDWLESIESYNNMKISIDFYNIFKTYDYMLTYELDSYIFSNHLEKNIFLQYDYVGAPFFEGYSTPNETAKFIDGGNSGFSLRNIQACIKVLKYMKSFYIQWIFYKIIFSKSTTLRFFLNYLTNNKYISHINGDLDFYFSRLHINEDRFWSQIVPRLFPYFKIADHTVALKFSFEINPSKMFELNNNQLPIGCHAWPKYKDFWKEYIEL